MIRCNRYIYGSLSTIFCVLLILCTTTNLCLGQNDEDAAFESSESEISSDKNTFGLSLVNGAFGVDLDMNQNYFSPIKLTYANQVFYERAFGSGYSVVVDVLYFIDDIPDFSNKGAISGRYEGAQFELGFAKFLYSSSMINSQLELSYLYANQQYEGAYFNLNNQIETFTYKIYGPKLAHKFSYRLNELFGLFWKFSFNYTTLDFDDIKSEEFTIMPIDALGFYTTF